MNSKYKFSVIVPVYNVEKYLKETLDSVVNQSIGFKNNVQLILVNDGSPDSSAEICVKYRDMYPENIVYIEKENGGVSSARNEGIKYIEGKYVNFLDSDDKWETDAFEKAYSFFEENYNEIDFVVCRTKFFEAKNGFHPLDYKFNRGTRIADINNPEEYFSIQLMCSPVFIKYEAIKALRFDTKVKYGEDSVFNNKIILEKCKIGFFKEAVYYYRKRISKDSAVDKQKLDKAYYKETLEFYYKELFDYSKEKFGRVIPFIQSVVAFDLMWHFDINETHEVLDDEEFEEFRQTSKELLEQIDDSIIFGHPLHKSFARRSVAVSFKYDIDYFKALTLEQSRLYFRGFEVFNMKGEHTLCVLNSINIKGKKCRLELLVAKWLLASTADGGRIMLKVGERFVKPDETAEYTKIIANTSEGGESYYVSCAFSFKLKIKKESALQIVPYFVFGSKMSETTINYGDLLTDDNRPEFESYNIDYQRDAITVTLKSEKNVTLA